MISQGYLFRGRERERDIYQSEDIWGESNFLDDFQSLMRIFVSSLSEQRVTCIASLNVNCHTDTAEITGVQLKKYRVWGFFFRLR